MTYMKRRIVIFLALLILATGLGLGIHQWTQRGVILLGDPSWPNLALKSLTRIELKSPESNSHFYRSADGWFIKPPTGGTAVRASEARLQSLLDTIGHTPPTAHVGRFTRREKSIFGLDNDATGITLEGNGIWGIALGADGPAEGTVYARSSLQGDQVVLVSNQYRNLFSKPESFFHDLRLVSTTEPEAITRISAEGPGVGVWEISRKGDMFAFTAPEQLTRHSVAQAKAALYLHMLVNARARKITADPQTALPPLSLKLSVWTKKSSTPETIELYHDGSDGKTFFCRLSRQTVPVEVEAELVDKLTASAFALREKPVLEVDLSQTEEQRFTVRRNGNVRTYAALRTPDGWHESASGKELTGLDVIMWRLGSLQFIEAPRKELPDGARSLLTWALRGQNKQLLATVHFYSDPASAGRCWVQVEGEDIWFPAERLLLDDLMSRLPTL
ncbi:DUF4340 domain-containing protein [Desulfovibrio mangrovi]|uniref:DUF4340 domain-containing protein n=1 Tax=Desulfovibrio mangrovi TaxID=2976983 RepID=UPI002246CF1A|nr:DUF4340 domain-containing protein [Desulfovibrio mangrovi]UZP66455.1 DUF4340 domain-containing protein [Desulfovibrio mangrovi]